MSDAHAIVFVLDGDVSVREALKALIVFAGWEARAFATAKDFLASQPAKGPTCRSSLLPALATSQQRCAP